MIGGSGEDPHSYVEYIISQHDLLRILFVRISEICESCSFIVHRAVSFCQVLFVCSSLNKKFKIISDCTMYDERTRFTDF